MDNFTYRYKSMELLQFAILADQYDPANTVANNELRYLFNEEDNTLYCIFAVTLATGDGTPVLKAELQSIFEIKPESVALITNGNKITFPANLIAHFASLTYSTLRGIIYAKSENTAFRDFILPVQNIQAQIKNPYVYYKVETAK